MEMRGSKLAAFEIQQTSKSSKHNLIDIIKSWGIQRETELLALADERADDGLGDLKAVIAETPERVYRELISKTWKLAEWPDLLVSQWQSQMERISSFSLTNCAEGCHQKLWIKMVKGILRNNKINACVFAEAIHTLL